MESAGAERANGKKGTVLFPTSVTRDNARLRTVRKGLRARSGASSATPRRRRPERKSRSGPETPARPVRRPSSTARGRRRCRSASPGRSSRPAAPVRHPEPARAAATGTAPWCRPRPADSGITGPSRCSSATLRPLLPSALGHSRRCRQSGFRRRRTEFRAHAVVGRVPCFPLQVQERARETGAGAAQLRPARRFCAHPSAPPVLPSTDRCPRSRAGVDHGSVSRTAQGQDDP